MRKREIPEHAAIPQSDFGIYAKTLCAGTPDRVVDYVHRDNYCVFGFIESGRCRVNVDFNEMELRGGELFCVMPRQVHFAADAGDARASLLLVDEALIAPSVGRLLAEYALMPAPLRAAEGQCRELKSLFSMILGRVEEAGDGLSKSLLQHLACAVVGMIAGIVAKREPCWAVNGRHLEIVLALRALLAAQERISRDISGYAERLCLSATYLNEAVRSVTGMSAGRYVQHEIVLQAKRMLVYTPLSVKQIAERLGMDDPAGFTRMFTRAAAMSPTAFRRKYLE